MKKFISLLITVCLCVSLVSCGHEHTWDGGKITTPATESADGVKTFTCTDCGETKTEAYKYSAKTTVASADEWEKLFAPTNCTIDGVYDEGGQETITITISDNKCVAIVIEPDEIIDFYIFQKDGVWYNGETGTRGLICWEDEDMTKITLGEIFEPLDYENDFESFSYNATKRAYVMQSSSASTSTEVYVSDGKLSKIIRYEDNTPTHTFVFSKYGDTVISNFPEFCFDHNFSDVWAMNENAHWYPCSTDGCGKSNEYNTHQWNHDETECTICGYTTE